MQTSVQAADPPSKPPVEISHTDKIKLPNPSPNKVVTGVILTQEGDNIPDDIVVKLVYYTEDARKIVRQTSHAGLFFFDLAGKARNGSPVEVIVSAQTIKEGHTEHKYTATRYKAVLSEGQNLTVAVEVSGLWDDMIMGDIGFIED